MEKLENVKLTFTNKANFVNSYFNSLMFTNICYNGFKATIMEVQRLSCVAPASIPHEAMKDSHFHGYFIPKGLLVLTIQLYVLHKEYFINLDYKGLHGWT